MRLVLEYRAARFQEDSSRLRRLIALRALAVTGSSQREIAAALGVSQSAVSQQLKAAHDFADVHRETLLKAAAPILVDVARSGGFHRLAVFGSVARGNPHPDSDIDLLVAAPPGYAIKEIVGLRDIFERSSADQLTSSPTAASRL